MHAQLRAFALLILAGCAPVSSTTVVASGADQTDLGGEGADGEQRNPDTTPDPEESTDAAPSPCDSLAPGNCLVVHGCVLEHQGHRQQPVCRAPRDSCESLAPDTIDSNPGYGAPTRTMHGTLRITQDDPCRAHEGCSFDAQMALCRASSSVSPRACDAIAPEQCLPWTGCVLDHGNGRPSCRAPADACEVLPPMTSAPSSFSDPYQSVYGQLVLGGADPCRNHDGCAFDLRSRLCRSYTPVAACPETLEEARSVHVACGHPDQPSLECRYRDDGRRSTFHCHRPSWNGGMAPPPEFENRPAVWRESAHQQDNGCPASRFGLRDRCRRARGRSCHLDDSIYECIGGRWRETRRLPPRP